MISMDMANVASATIPRKLGYEFAGEGDLPIEAPARTGQGLFWKMDRSSWLTNATG